MENACKIYPPQAQPDSGGEGWVALGLLIGVLALGIWWLKRTGRL